MRESAIRKHSNESWRHTCGLEAPAAGVQKSALECPADSLHEPKQKPL